ncbi:hypothetical protein [Haematospirillum jordaniae]|uniref:Uncharacterized protein n=1 Tax=Haematospirillum jordaniae TaxID=1549855 RepID=A0A143DHQ2_9PROT|nr:hypothetical protein [Haematospirillum jordaniae]AMW35843.1 hypothetical protein AY555_10745 [Haematospirillum jordaniae]
MTIINTRADLDALKGTPAHDEFLRLLRGTMTTMTDTQTYPEDYGKPEYDRPKLDPVWVEVETLETITRFGFTKEELMQESPDMGGEISVQKSQQEG